MPNNYSYKNIYLENNAKDIEALILGNSHTYRGVLPEYFDLNSFNVAYFQQTLNIDFLILEKYKKRFENLKIIVINISYPSLFSSIETSVESWRLKNYNIYYDLHLNNTIKNHSEFLTADFTFAMKKLKYFYVDKIDRVNCTLKGGGPLEGNRNLIKTGIKSAKRHTKEKLPNYKENIVKLGEMIDFANKHKIKVVFSTPPAYKTYREHLDTNQLQLMNTILDSLTINNSNVSRINLLESDLFVEQDFLDADHLNEEGAIKHLKILNKFINNRLD